jgi:predicted RNase H-like nuclease
LQELYQKAQEADLSYPKCSNIYNPSKESEPMKTLFHVIVVTTKEVVLVDEKVVGSDADEAKFLAGVYAAIREAKLLPKDVTIICNMLGQVKVEKVVGSDADEAKFLAGVYAAIREAKLLPKDVTIICNMLGQVKVEKEPEKVKIVKEA